MGKPSDEDEGRLLSEIMDFMMTAEDETPRPSREGGRRRLYGFDLERHGARVSELVREANLRVGSVVDRSGHACLVYNINLRQNDVYLRNLNTGVCYIDSFLFFRTEGEVDRLQYQVLYTPPAGYDSPMVALEREPGEKIKAYRTRTQKLLSRIGPRLAATEKYIHPVYGEFWLRSAAARIATEPQTPKTAVQQPQKPPTGHALLKLQQSKYAGRTGFCMYCKHEIKQAAHETCFVCERRSASTRPKTRFCVLCGTQLPNMDANMKRYIRLCEKDAES